MSAALVQQQERLKAARARIAAAAFVRVVAAPPAPVVIPFTVQGKPVKERSPYERAMRCLRLISRIHGVPRDEVRSGKRRSVKTIIARHHYTWMLWRLTDWSLNRIAAHQDKDHTTILSALQMLSKRRPHRKSYREVRGPKSFPCRPWSAEEDAVLLRLFEEGGDDVAISAATGRSVDGVKGRRHALRLLRVVIR